ncbi:ATP-binding protein [Streptomyces sp. NPDC090306]|uniref:ATP-binding protein n=1 Tax=unclassified Streptomyces TaxID=2593676 RepID=UPI0036E42A50
MADTNGSRGVPGVTSAAAARAHAQEVVRGQWCPPARRPRDEDLIDLQLVVSELVTNAIRHGDGLAGFEAVPTAEGLHLTVHDRSDVVPEVAYGSGALPVGHQGNGYGWPLIIRLARDITIRLRPEGGKSISVLVPIRTVSDTEDPGHQA